MEEMGDTCPSVASGFKFCGAFTSHLTWKKVLNGPQACKWPWQFPKKKTLKK